MVLSVLFLAGSLQMLGQVESKRSQESTLMYFQALLDAKTIQEHERALTKLLGHGESAVSVLVRELQSNDIARRAAAASSLRQFGKQGKAALPAIISTLQNDRDPGVRSLAAHAIAEIADGNEQVIAVLAAAVEKEANYGAAEALARFGKDAKRAVPAIIKALENSEDDLFRYELVWALKMIGPEASDAASVLGNLLMNDNEDIRQASAIALETIGLKAKKAIPALEQAVDGAADRYVGAAGLKVLYHDLDLRVYYASALASVDSGNAKALARLIQCSSDENVMTRCFACEGLGVYRGRPEVIKALKIALKDENEYVRQSANDALEKVAPK